MMLDEYTLAAYLDGYERAVVETHTQSGERRGRAEERRVVFRAAVERAILAHRATLEMTQAVPLLRSLAALQIAA